MFQNVLLLVKNGSNVYLVENYTVVTDNHFSVYHLWIFAGSQGATANKGYFMTDQLMNVLLRKNVENIRELTITMNLLLRLW